MSTKDIKMVLVFDPTTDGTGIHMFDVKSVTYISPFHCLIKTDMPLDKCLEFGAGEWLSPDEMQQSIEALEKLLKLQKRMSE